MPPTRGQGEQFVWRFFLNPIFRKRKAPCVFDLTGCGKKTHLPPVEHLFFQRICKVIPYNKFGYHLTYFPVRLSHYDLCFCPKARLFFFFMWTRLRERASSARCSRSPNDPPT